MTDLCTRLRAKAQVWRDRNSIGTARLLDEAADAIEELSRLGNEMLDLAEAHSKGVENPHCGCYFKGEACCWCGEKLIDKVSDAAEARRH